MEPIAKEKYSLVFGSNIKPVGLCVDSNIFYLAASPGNTHCIFLLKKKYLVYFINSI